MPRPWRIDAEIVGGPAKNCAELFEYLRAKPTKDAREPPRKKRRTNEHVGEGGKGNEVDESDAVLLAFEELLLQFPPSTSSAPAFEEAVDVLVSVVHPDKNGNVFVTLRPNLPRHLLLKSPVTIHLRLDSSPISLHLTDITFLSNITRSKGPIAWTRCILTPQENQNEQLCLRTQIFWAPERSLLAGRKGKESKLLETILGKYLPPEQPRDTSPWSPGDFYENVHVPPAREEIPACLDKTDLSCRLYPFQKRAVKWLMRREGVTFENGAVVSGSSAHSSGGELPVSFIATKDRRGDDCCVSYVHGTVSKSLDSLASYKPILTGGILAEEMGLGKTVEIIALATLHRQADGLKGAIIDGLTRSPATLIITPSHILQQWKDEIATHAPNLKVAHFSAFSARRFTVENLLEYDIILTTYNVLSSEIHYAETPPDRSLRHAPKRERPRSPLVLTKWWRVCLDEAQMVETQVSQAARVATLIPRVNAWAISGTPLKANVADLHGLLIFLRYEPFASSKAAWKRLDKETLRQIFGTIALRHNKHKIAHELQLPPQRRIVITMPFTQIEEQNYDQLFKQMCGVLGLNGDGTPAIDEYDPNSPRVVEHMRTWLRRLRETCLHPQVGIHNRRALGRSTKALRTVNEVLETMMEQNETDVHTQERTLIYNQVVRAHVVNNDKSNLHRSRDALVIYQNALDEICSVVEHFRKEYGLEKTKLSKDASAEADQTDASENEYDSDGELLGDAKDQRLAGVKMQLRSALEAQHVCTFFVATSYFQIKENKGLDHTAEEITRLEELEAQNYDNAKAIRRELLLSNYKKATRQMKNLSRRLADRKEGLRALPENIPVVQTKGGIETQKLVEKVDQVSETMEKIAKLINHIIGKTTETLLRPLVDAEDGQEMTGEEYEDSTKLQDELYVYITCLSALVADYQRCISGEINLLNSMDMKKYIKDAKKGEGHAPELLLKLTESRGKVLELGNNLTLRGTIAEARSVATDLKHGPRGLAEGALIEELIREIQPIASAQSKAVDTLEKDLALYRSCMNERLEYYRQLQRLSDMVEPYKEELDENLDIVALNKYVELEKSHTAQLATLKTRRRFLEHLNAEATGQTRGRICVICTDPFEQGVLTICGHQYCKECITAWFRSHRTCPECRRGLGVNDFHDITYKAQQIRAQKEHNDKSVSGSPSSSQDNTASSRLAGSSIYSDMSATAMEEIRAVELAGSFGTKIDTICRHLIWLRENDPGAKSIIFSQYGTFLSVLSMAMKHFKISCVSIHEQSGIEMFRRDPSKECFLLDAKSDSSGLNLLNATHVFLCEPLINAAIELQAIARVHRIGQMRETTVYMYLTTDTVEEAIYEISVARRLAHMGKTSSSSSNAASSTTTSRAQTPAANFGENALEKANNLELQQAPVQTLLAKGKLDGELVGGDDLWNCLFGRPRGVGGGVSRVLQREVDRHSRAEAAVERREDLVESLSTTAAAVEA